MNKIKKVLVYTSWYPSKSNPFDKVFVRDQIQILNKFFNSFNNEIQYKFCVLHVAFPVDCVKYLIKDIKPENYSESDAVENYPIIHSQGLIISYRFNFFDMQMERVATQSGWSQSEKFLGGIPDIILAITLYGLTDLIEFLEYKNLKIPVVFQEHSVPITMHIKTPGRKARSINALSKTDRIIAVANRQISEISELCGGKEIEVIPNPARQEFFDCLINSVFNDTINIVTVGHLNDQKAQYRLILGAANFIKKNKNVNIYLTIVGDGANKQKLIELAKRENIENLTTFTGALNTLQIIEILKKSDIFVLSSKYENCPVALIEAQAMGLPCICTINDASELILIEGNGVTVAQDETGESISLALKTLIAGLNNYDKEEIRRRAKATYSPEVFAKRFYNTFASLLNK